MWLSRHYIPVIGRRLNASLAKARPPFHDVFPQKKMINRLLFELDSRLTFAKLYPLYEKLYKEMDKEVNVAIPKGFEPKDLMIMKKVLEKVRHKTKAINKNLIRLENELLDKAAEMGDNDAIALLCFDVLKDPSVNTKEDVDHGRKLIKALYKLDHPLTIKLTADLALKSQDDKAAEEYYLKFLNLQDDTFLAGEVYGQLGQINFRKPDLVEAEKCFLKSIQLSPIDYSVRSYFLLGQMYVNNDIFKARSLIESSATQGFKESFRTLGFLEMNYFKDLPKAQEWFKLGMELYDIDCFIGYFDCAINRQEYLLAKKCYQSMEKIASKNEEYKNVLHEFMKHRENDVKKINEHSSNASTDLLRDVQKSEVKLSKDNKWNL